jgi:hypothetical protein
VQVRYADLISYFTRKVEEVESAIWHRSVCFAVDSVFTEMCFLAVPAAIPGYSTFATPADALIVARAACTATIGRHVIGKIVTSTSQDHRKMEQIQPDGE